MRSVRSRSGLGFLKQDVLAPEELVGGDGAEVEPTLERAGYSRA